MDNCLNRQCHLTHASQGVFSYSTNRSAVVVNFYIPRMLAVHTHSTYATRVISFVHTACQKNIATLVYNAILVSVCVHCLDVEVVYGQTASSRVGSWAVDSRTSETKRGLSPTDG